MIFHVLDKCSGNVPWLLHSSRPHLCSSSVHWIFTPEHFTKGIRPHNFLLQSKETKISLITRLEPRWIRTFSFQSISTCEKHYFTFSLQTKHKGAHIFCIFVNGGFIWMWPEHWITWSLVRNGKTIGWKCRSALLHMKPTTSPDFHCIALLFFGHELLSLDYLVLTHVCWYSLESWPRASWNCHLKEHLRKNTSAARLLWYTVILVNTTKNTRAVVHTESINHWQSLLKVVETNLLLSLKKWAEPNSLEEQGLSFRDYVVRAL